MNAPNRHISEDPGMPSTFQTSAQEPVGGRCAQNHAGALTREEPGR